MAGFTDFLFNGTPPPIVSSDTNTQGQLPLWYSKYMQGLFNRSSAIAGEDFQAYGGQRLAEPNAMQTQARERIGETAEAWQPLMAEAGAAAARGAGPFNAGDVEQYRSPFMGGVVDEIARLGNENFSENVMPAINSNFGMAGQHGSKRHMDFVGRAARDSQREIMGQQSLALQRGQEAAMQNYGQWTDRALTGGKQLGALSELQQQLDTRTSAALETAGGAGRADEQANLDLAYNDFLEQRGYPKEQAEWMSNIIRGHALDSSNTQMSGSPASSYSPSPLANLSALWMLGAGMNT